MKYYQVDYLDVDMSGVIFYIGYIPFFGIVGHFIEKYTLRSIVLFTSGLTLVSTILKMFVASPDRFYLVLVSQTLAAIAQNFIANLPSKVACSWFGAEEVSTACAIGILGTQLGIALSMVVPTLVIRNCHNRNIVTEDLDTFFAFNASVCAGMFLIVLIVVRSEPPLPPSQSEVSRMTLLPSEEKMSYLKAIKTLSKNRDYLIVVGTLGTAFGIWLLFGVIINQIYMNSIPGSTNAEVGIMSFAAVISGGGFGTLIFGYILDKTHQYKLVSLSLILGSTLSTIAQAICMQLANRIGFILSAISNGFFSGSIMVVVYEYVVETTFPLPEVIGTSILNVEATVVAIILVLVLDYVFETVSYLAGYVILVTILASATISLSVASPELKRRNANLNNDRNKESKPLLEDDTPSDSVIQP